MAETMAETTEQRIRTHGRFIDLGGLWVRHDAIATVKEIVNKDNPPGAGGDPYCQVVLSVPGHRTLGVSCSAEELLKVIYLIGSKAEHDLGYDRARGMRNAGA